MIKIFISLVMWEKLNALIKIPFITGQVDYRYWFIGSSIRSQQILPRLHVCELLEDTPSPSPTPRKPRDTQTIPLFVNVPGSWMSFLKPVIPDRERKLQRGATETGFQPDLWHHQTRFRNQSSFSGKVVKENSMWSQPDIGTRGKKNYNKSSLCAQLDSGS